MKIGLIGDRIADVPPFPETLDGIGAVLSQRFETLVASGAAAAAFGDLLTEFRQSGGRLMVVLPPTPAGAASTEAWPPAAEVRQASTHAEYLDALLGDVDALLCCPGGIATLHELHHFLDAGLRAAAPDRPLVYLYDRDHYFAPFRLQVQVLVEAGGAPAAIERAIRPFESVRGLRALL